MIGHVGLIVLVFGVDLGMGLQCWGEEGLLCWDWVEEERVAIYIIHNEHKMCMRREKRMSSERGVGRGWE